MSEVESTTWADNLRNKYGIAEPVDDTGDDIDHPYSALPYLWALMTGSEYPG